MNIRKRVRIAFKHRLEETGAEKTKVKYLLNNRKKWKPGHRQEYMNKLTRYQASLIFRARTRMLKFKDNFRGMYKDNICRICKIEKETQEHIMSCINTIESFKIRTEEIFSNNLAILKNAARKLKILTEKLDNMEKETIEKKKPTKGKKRKATGAPQIRTKKRRRIETTDETRERPIDDTLREILNQMGIFLGRPNPAHTDTNAQHPPNNDTQGNCNQQSTHQEGKLKIRMRKCLAINTRNNKVATRWKIIE